MKPLTAVCLLILMLLGGGVWWLTERYAGQIDRVGDVFAGIPESSRPAAPTGGERSPVTFLLVGSDSRDVSSGAAPGARSDAIMLARLEADRQHAQLISIPRDSWVEIPGHGMNKVNASYAIGGPPLLVHTLEQLTGVRIDHFIAVDFAGLASVTDALGGVDVYVQERTQNGGHTFEQGVNHITGEEARWYLGQRYGLPGGDFDRVKRQQHFLKAVMDRMVSSQTFGDLGRLDRTLRAVAGSVATDDALSQGQMLSLAYSMRDISKEDVAYFTAPVVGTGREGAASVVYLDAAAGGRMWGYLATDSLGDNAAEFRESALSDAPR